MALKIRSRPLSVVSDDELEALHSASLRILEEIGVEMLEPQALDVLAAAGAEADHRTHRVRLPRDLVMSAVEKAPSIFTVHARNPQRDVVIGRDNMALLPVAGPAMVSDLESGRRPGTLADQVNFIKLAQVTPLMDMVYPCVEALDISVAFRHLDCLLSSLSYSDKPFGALHLNEERAVDAIAMASLASGEGPGAPARPLLLAGVNVDTPLRFSSETLQTLLVMAGAGQAIKITPFALPGVMSPATPAGAIALLNAEALAGITLVQTINPGNPVVYGSFPTQADMRTVAPAFSTGRALRMEVVCGQLARRYRLPHRGMGLVTNSNSPDAQAAWEKCGCLWTLAQANTQVLIHAAGWLDNGLTASYEQFVFDLEMIASFADLFAPLIVDDATLALDTVAEVGPGGSYLLADHTIANLRTMGAVSPLIETRPHEPWSTGAEVTSLMRANLLWKKMLADYIRPEIDPAIDEALRAYVERRRRGEPPPTL